MEQTQKNEQLAKLSTFDLAFQLATGKLDEKEKFDALSIIKSREPNGSNAPGSIQNQAGKALPTPIEGIKLPIKGSKAEKIYQMAKKGKTAKQIFTFLEKEKITVYYPEIYRVMRKYGFIEYSTK